MTIHSNFVKKKTLDCRNQHKRLTELRFRIGRVTRWRQTELLPTREHSKQRNATSSRRLRRSHFQRNDFRNQLKMRMHRWRRCVHYHPRRHQTPPISSHLRHTGNTSKHAQHNRQMREFSLHCVWDRMTKNGQTHNTKQMNAFEHGATYNPFYLQW